MWGVLLALVVAFEAAADVFAKSWSVKGGVVLAATALTLYVVDNTFWLFALRGGAGLARGGILFSVASALLAAVIGVFVFRETLTTTQTLGIIVGLAAVGLLSW
ncbi:MAG: hypothetical protein U1A28_04140 [Patescibacteria group bacterium]|nr:hypothetical protein [Patescibacteria group bacterium]